MQPMINALLDPVVNFGKVTVSTGYTSTDTEIHLITGDGSKLPNPVPSGSFNLVWFNNSTYSDPADDPYVEIVRCIARVGNTLTLMRAQEGTLASDKNIPTKIYKMILSPTKKTIDDIQTESQSKVNTHSLLSTGVHGIGADTIDGVNARNIAISTHSLTTSNVHGFDASGDAPAQIHGISRHTGIIGDHTTNISNVGTNTHSQIDTAITNSINHIASNGTSVHGLGTMSTQNGDAVSIIGGSITGITDLAVADGGTGGSTTVAYTPICGGITITSPMQSVTSTGTSGQVLTSNGPGALPTFQTVAGGSDRVLKAGDTMTGTLVIDTMADVPALKIVPATDTATTRFMIQGMNAANNTDKFTVDNAGNIITVGNVDGVDVSSIPGLITAHVASNVSASVHPNAVRLNGDNTGKLSIGTQLRTTNLSVTSVSLDTLLTGTLSITQNSAAVTGTGTLFITELAVGDKISIQYIGSRIVATITDNTHLTLTGVLLAGNMSGLLGYCDPVPFDIYVDGNTVMKVSKIGNIGIGVANPSYKLQLNGQPAANGYTAWTNYSDSRLKENIVDLITSENALDLISQLRPVTFNYNELTGYDAETRSRRISGLIAQELQSVFPQMVGTIKINDVEYFDSNLSDLPLYIVKAIQELKARIEELEKKAAL